MMGRYGTDQLNLFLILLSFAIEIAGIFVWQGIMTWIALVPLIWSIVRTFSRNIQARQRENMRFLQWLHSVRTFFPRLRARLADRKVNRIFQCPSCGQKVRVPKHKGRLRITCPQCGTKFERKT